MQDETTSWLVQFYLVLSQEQSLHNFAHRDSIFASPHSSSMKEGDHIFPYICISIKMLVVLVNLNCNASQIALLLNLWKLYVLIICFIKKKIILIMQINFVANKSERKCYHFVDRTQKDAVLANTRYTQKQIFGTFRKLIWLRKICHV